MGVGRKFWGGFFLVLLAGAVTGCVRVEAGERRRFQTVFVGSMDTVTRFTAYCRDDAEFDRACEQVREGLEEADALFNAYRTDSALSRVNAGAGAGPVAAEPALAAALEEVRRGGVSAFFGAVRSAERAVAADGDFAWFVGPEGGFTEEEESAMREAGVRGLNLGPYVLRLETAAVCGLAVLRQWMR